MAITHTAPPAAPEYPSLRALLDGLAVPDARVRVDPTVDDQDAAIRTAQAMFVAEGYDADVGVWGVQADCYGDRLHQLARHLEAGTAVARYTKQGRVALACPEDTRVDHLYTYGFVRAGTAQERISATAQAARPTETCTRCWTVKSASGTCLCT